jgi:hypothetical protein
MNVDTRRCSRRWSGDTVVDDVQGMFDGLQSDLKDT